MNPIYETIRSKHQSLLGQWDGLLPEETAGLRLAERRLQRSSVLLIAAGPVGYQTAVNLVQLPLAQLTLIGLHAADLEPLVRVSDHPQRRTRSVIVAPQPFMLAGLGILMERHQVTAIAGGRPHPDIMEQVNSESMRAGTSWTHVALWGAEIFCGPTVIPGVTACYACYTRRRQSNEKRTEAARATDYFLRNDPSFEFQGQIAPVINLAAAYASAEVERFLHGFPAPVTLGRLLTIDILAQSIVTDFVVPFEWCPVCRAWREEGSDDHDTLAAMIARRRARLEGFSHAAS